MSENASMEEALTEPVQALPEVIEMSENATIEVVSDPSEVLLKVNT